MLLQFLFKTLSVARKAAFMKRRGIVVGTRTREGRLQYLYMVNNLFAEIQYENDDPRMKVESITVLNGLNQLNRYMENDIREGASEPCKA